MGPSLHQWYTADEAIAAFGEARKADFLCDGQFVVLPKVVLCLATVGKAATDPYIGVPSSFCWKPGRLNYDPTDEVPWLPTKAREVRGPDREKIKEHHIFLRAPGDERFGYIGSAHLGSWGNNGMPGNEVAGFSLEVKLPRDLWLHLGGYQGWCAVLNHQEASFLDKEDVAGFQRLVDELPRQEFSHLELTRYEEDRLFVAMNPRRGWLSYQRSFRNGLGFHVRDLNYSGDPESIECFWCDCGLDVEAPTTQTLPRALCMTRPTKVGKHVIYST